MAQAQTPYKRMEEGSPGQASAVVHATDTISAEKSNKSAIVIIPPEECWEQIQNIRRSHDRAFNRWMPHINLIYPFLEDAQEGRIFQEAAAKIQASLPNIQPFSIKFDKLSFNYFKHRKNSTLWLNPESDGKDVMSSQISNAPHSSVLKIQRELELLFPECKDLSAISEHGYTPHLSLGQFPTKQVDKALARFQEDWKTIEFEVKHIFLISRRDFDDPFHIRQHIALGQ